MDLESLNSSIETSLERVNSAVWKTSDIEGKAKSTSEKNWVSKGLISKNGKTIMKQGIIKGTLMEFLKGLTRGVLIGFGLKGSLAAIFFLLQRKNLNHLLSSVFSRDVFLFTRFVALYLAILRGVNAFMFALRQKNDKFNSTLAATVASSAILLEDKRRRIEIGLYLLFRAVFVSGKWLVRKEILPVIPYFKQGIFGVINIPIMYGFLYDPSILQKGYYKWILGMGNVTHDGLNNTMRTERRLYAANDFAGILKLDHYHEGPCTRYCMYDWLLGLVRAGKIYLPVHLIPLLLFRYKKLYNAPIETSFRTFSGFLKSCLFLTTYQIAIKSNMCGWRHILGYYPEFGPVTAALSTSLGCFFETDSRVTELMLYCCPRSAESAYLFLNKKGLVTLPQYIIFPIFAFASAILVSASDKDFKSTYYKALVFLIGS